MSKITLNYINGRVNSLCSVVDDNSKYIKDVISKLNCSSSTKKIKKDTSKIVFLEVDAKRKSQKVYQEIDIMSV